MRLAASFPLWCTTSIDVFCLNFGGVWETLWIFKVVRWTHDRCIKINKSPTVSNGIRASSFEIWTANLAQSFTLGTLTKSRSFIFGDSSWKICYVTCQLPCRHPNKTRHSDENISDFGIFLNAFIWVEKSQNLLDIQEQYICKPGVNTKWAETFIWCLLLIFKVVDQEPLTQLLPFAWDFVDKGE